jgi:3-oxoacyl-[acyl-carrier-protein] synthase II
VVAAGYLKMGALSASVEDPAVVTRPFDRRRDGFVMGEGAGVVVLEERGRALERGATVLAELAGYAATCDAGHPTDPDPEGGGAARAIALALSDAGLGIDDIGYVNAHATSTLAGDTAEVRALVRAGLCAAAVSSTKGLHGHALGAAGGLELVALLGVFVRDFLPANVNLDDRDDDGALDLITSGRPTAVGAAMSNSFGFGGHNACLVLRRHEAATG